jgi:hypothetical protein
MRRARQVQSDEYQGLGYAEKWARLAFREQLLLDIEERLKDPDLSHTQAIDIRLRRTNCCIPSPRSGASSMSVPSLGSP